MKRLDGLIVQLDQTRSVTIHQAVSQSYYMLKREELRLRMEQLVEAEAALDHLCKAIKENYEHVFRQWSHDVRWLSANRENQKPRPIL